MVDNHDVLFNAIEQEDIQSIERLVPFFGTEVTDEGGMTPLMYAASLRSARVVQCLLSLGAIVDAVDHDLSTALCQAAEQDENTAVVQSLLAAGAEPNHRDARGMTPLMRAAARGDIECVDALLRHPKINANSVSKDEETALTYAVVWGRHEVVKQLVGHGADIHWRGPSGWGAKEYARQSRDPKMISLVDRLSANVNTCTQRE